jgi:hypothetical protein
VLLLLSVPGSTSPPHSCEDEYPDCLSRAAAGECHGGHQLSSKLALSALTDCRVSCRASYQEGRLPTLVNEFGGVGDVVKDVFGVEIPICDPEEGLDRVYRKTVLAHLVAGKRVSHWLPAFTDDGWKVETVPSEVMGMLSLARLRGEGKKQTEPCGPHYSPKNCQVLVEDEGECSVKHSGKLELIPLDPMTKRTVLEMMRPRAEQWAGSELKNTAVYGVVRYKKGARLAAHTDMMATHTIGAIINVDQKGTQNST